MAAELELGVGLTGLFVPDPPPEGFPPPPGVAELVTSEPATEAGDADLAGQKNRLKLTLGKLQNVRQRRPYRSSVTDASQILVYPYKTSTKCVIKNDLRKCSFCFFFSMANKRKATKRTINRKLMKKATLRKTVLRVIKRKDA